MEFDFLVSGAVTLIVVVDPVGFAPIFLAVTKGLPAPAQRRVARRASLIAALILAGAALWGDWLLRKLGISLPAFRIAGGLLLFALAASGRQTSYPRIGPFLRRAARGRIVVLFF